ncbi:retrotransposon protein, putative, ty1-copia subclass [Tanacetum coccineum]
MFSMKELGEAAFILGIKIYRDRSRRLIGLSQNAYLDKILKRYRMDNSKRGSIPMQVDLHLSKSQCATTSAEMKRMQNVPYASAVGSIMYVVRCTRPDVAFAQNIISRFQQNSGKAHWTAVYLRNTKDTFLVYGGNPEAELRVNYYCDAGFETDRDDTKSQTGYVFVLNGGAVVWKSSKQSTTAQHATEAEYIAASEAAKEAVWIRKFIDELGVVPSNDYPIKMNCDNSAAIIMAKESGIQKGARHFKRKYHYVRECIETGKIDIVKVHTDDNLADSFTKNLAASSTSLLQRFISLLHAEFAMTDLGPLNYFIGISATRTTSGIFLTPIDTEKKLRPEGSPVTDPTLYHSLAGLLQYLTFTRPDLSYAVQQLCLYMRDPREPHINAMKRVLCCPATRRSTFGYCVFLGENLLTWSSKRQDTLSRSNAEAEYRGVVNAVAETSWIHNLFCELHTPLLTVTLVYCDNVSAVYMFANPVQHQRTKHIEIDIHFVRDKVAAGHVRVLHVPSRFQYADIFTKGLPYTLFADFRSSLSVHKSPAPTAGAY